MVLETTLHHMRKHVFSFWLEALARGLDPEADDWPVRWSAEETAEGTMDRLHLRAAPGKNQNKGPSRKLREAVG